MKIPVSGTFHNIDGGVAVGDVVEVDDDNGARYCWLGYAEKVTKKPDPEPEPVEEHATLPEPVAETATLPRRGPGRPPKGVPPVED